MDRNTLHYRHILLYYFKKGKRAAEAHKKICRVYGDSALTERTYQNWFAKFRAENFDINNAPGPGRLQEIEIIDVKAIVDQNPSQSVRDIAHVLEVSHTSVENHLRKLGYVSVLIVWVPHSLTKANLATCISICDSHRKCQESDPFLKRLGQGMWIGCGKWIVYDKIIRSNNIG
ncbi:histone-lysine N-methyltransferase SETMAR-like [Halyomorpha halys]|uniref:histone-lysine N-methyltransferase SETMAR-like n=1 Tax=Halyomorpha halys TaxID=286706 RepID=UPI0006D526F3|nr:histone-lysine N-methyltransferase SETMAR-like [Halyomorpha halys]